MRTLTILRTLVLAAALSAPLAQAALASQVQQAAVQQNATSNISNGDLYNDAVMAPAIGD